MEGGYKVGYSLPCSPALRMTRPQCVTYRCVRDREQQRVLKHGVKLLLRSGTGASASCERSSCGTGRKLRSICTALHNCESGASSSMSRRPGTGTPRCQHHQQHCTSSPAASSSTLCGTQQHLTPVPLPRSPACAFAPASHSSPGYQDVTSLPSFPHAPAHCATTRSRWVWRSAAAWRAPLCARLQPQVADSVTRQQRPPRAQGPGPGCSGASPLLPAGGTALMPAARPVSRRLWSRLGLRLTRGQRSLAAAPLSPGPALHHRGNKAGQGMGFEP